MRYTCEQVDLKRKDNGKALYLTRYSCPASWDNKNILCVHGLTYTQHAFDMNYKDYSVCKYFAKHGYNVWRLDIGGYGNSEKYDDGFEVTTMNAAEDEIYALEKICEVMKVEKVDLLGWSWGTMTTSKVASLRPDLLHKVVWLGPCFGGAFPAQPVTEPFSDIDYGYIIRVFQHVPGTNDLVTDFDTIEPEVQGLWVDHTMAQDAGHGRPNGGAKEIMEIGDGWLIDTKAVKVPVLIIAGDNDFYVNIDRCYQAEKELPAGSKLVHMHGAGHAMYLEKDYYQWTREEILKFISED